MRKILALSIVGMLLTGSADAQASVKKIITYSKNGWESRVLTLLSDNTLWWAAPNKQYSQVTQVGLPKNAEILDVETYQKTNMMGGSETRMIILLGDNSIWWYDGGKDWEQIEASGLPAGKKIKDVAVYVKGQGAALMESMRMVAVMEDNSMFWFAPKKAWEPLENKGLPVGK